MFLWIPASLSCDALLTVSLQHLPLAGGPGLPGGVQDGVVRHPQLVPGREPPGHQRRGVLHQGHLDLGGGLRRGWGGAGSQYVSRTPGIPGTITRNATSRANRGSLKIQYLSTPTGGAEPPVTSNSSRND